MTRFRRPALLTVAAPTAGRDHALTAFALAAALAEREDLGRVVCVDVSNPVESTLSGLIRRQNDYDRTTLLNGADWIIARGVDPADVEVSCQRQENAGGTVFWVLTAPASEWSGPIVLRVAEFERLYSLLAASFDVIVLDAGSPRSFDGWDAAMRRTDALVVPITWAPEDMDAASQLLGHLRGYATVDSARVVVAGYPARRGSRWALRSAAESFAGLALMALPAEKRLAIDPLPYDELRAGTRRGFGRLAELALRQARKAPGMAASGATAVPNPAARKGTGS